MDNVSKDRLDQLLRTSPGALTQDDKDFLKAREAYLTDDDKRVFADLFEAPKKAKAGKNDE